MDEQRSILPPHNPFVGTIHHGKGKVVYFSPLRCMKYDEKSPYLPFIRHAPASRMLWDLYNPSTPSINQEEGTVHNDKSAEADLQNGNWIFVPPPHAGDGAASRLRFTNGK